MVVIRMARGGSKKNPFYRIVVADKRAPRDGKYIERLGFFNPVASGQDEALRLDLERLDHWVSIGAQCSDTVSSLVKDARDPKAKQERDEKKAKKSADKKANKEKALLAAAKEAAAKEAAAKEAAAKEAVAKEE